MRAIKFLYTLPAEKSRADRSGSLVDATCREVTVFQSTTEALLENAQYVLHRPMNELGSEDSWMRKIHHSFDS